MAQKRFRECITLEEIPHFNTVFEKFLNNNLCLKLDLIHLLFHFMCSLVLTKIVTRNIKYSGLNAEYSIQYNRTKKKLSLYLQQFFTVKISANEKRGKTKICKLNYSVESGKTPESYKPQQLGQVCTDNFQQPRSHRGGKGLLIAPIVLVPLKSR